MKNRWVALIVLCTGFLMIILDQTIVNVALPSIQKDLHFSPANLAWVVNAYLIAFGGLLLLAGRLGDLIGRKTVFLSGVFLFTAASVWCGASNSEGMLIAARFVQGAGGAVTSAVLLGMVVTLFPEPAGQAKAIGVYSFVGSGGASIGLLAGGVLTEAISWHWIFYVNIPVGLAVGLVGLKVLDKESGAGLSRGADVLGSLLVTATLMLGVYTILKVEDHGWLSGHTLGFGAATVVLLAAFVVRQAKAKTPILPLAILRTPNLAGANLVLGMMLAGMFGYLFLGSLYLQYVLDYDPLEIGLAFLPVAVAIGLFSLIVSPRLNMRFGMKAVLLPSLASIAIGLALLGRAPVGGQYVSDVLPALLLLGIGGGLAFPALVQLAMSGARPEDSGLASGINNTMQQVGGALGLAVLATLAASRTRSAAADGQDTAASLVSGYHLAFAVASGIVVAGLVVGALVLRKPPAPAAAAPADEAAAPLPRDVADNRAG
ncbi:MFS transporter [Streptomyces sp. NBC_00102]|uniref:MFS transporter n=1 Tax=Streptomyces sp. NBC_00102 TaxID=2975652 RepID=UPI002B1E3DB4|nr:MFS transporter [Streptomyces sp. NBC_00102]